MKTFYFEMTDTFGGELNYCWLNRFTVKAKTMHGALCKLSRHTGFNFNNNGLYYKVRHACIALYEYHDGMEIPDNDWINASKEL